jgi:hypothetical protein
VKLECGQSILRKLLKAYAPPKRPQDPPEIPKTPTKFIHSELKLQHWQAKIPLQEKWKLTLCLEDPYTLEQLSAPAMISSIVQPLVDRFYDAYDVSAGTNNVHLIHSSRARLTRSPLDSLLPAGKSSAIPP